MKKQKLVILSVTLILGSLLQAIANAEQLTSQRQVAQTLPQVQTQPLPGSSSIKKPLPKLEPLRRKPKPPTKRRS